MKVVAAILMASLLALPSTPASTADYRQARALYYHGSDGDKDAYEQSAKLFDTLQQQQPGNPLIEVYTGSIRLWQASHTWALWKKNSLSKEGIEMMDRAVSADPKNLEIRFVRAVTDYNLPSFFHRRDQAAQEFQLLAKQAPGKLEPRLAAASLYFHAMFLQEASDTKAAEAAFKQAIALAPQSRAARDSADELRKLSR